MVYSPDGSFAVGASGDTAGSRLTAPDLIISSARVTLGAKPACTSRRFNRGSATATAFLAADLVDRILIYRAPILVGEGKSSFGYIGLDAIADAHGRWKASDGTRLGIDRLEVYERVRD